MAKLSDLKVGDSIWVDHHKIRPAVVISVGPTAVLLICGTSRAGVSPHVVCVQPRSPAATAMGIDRPTYFYPSGVAVRTDLAAVVDLKRRPPPNIMHALEALAELSAQKLAVVAPVPSVVPPPVPALVPLPSTAEESLLEKIVLTGAPPPPVDEEG